MANPKALPQPERRSPAGRGAGRRLAPALAAAALLAMTPAASPAAAASPYGINVHAPQGPQLAFVLDRVQAAGIGWVRIDFLWSAVETSPGVFDWSVYDALTAAALARGINIYATLAYTPAWATHGPPTTGVPDDPATWSDFCARAAQRYASTIQYWGLWNEPNSSRFWSGSRQQFIDDILVPGADAIHGANAAAKVGGPELAHVASSQWYYWLRDILNQAGSHLDFVSHHVYDVDGNRAVTNRLNGSTPFGGDPGLWTIIEPSVKEVLQDAGWWGKPFWLTETGWQSGEVSEATQATYYAGLLSDWFTGQSGQGWVDQIFFYEVEDPPGAPTTWGILRADGSEKPAYGAYQNFITGHTFKPAGDAQLIASTLPTSMETGQVITVRLTFKNTGASTWTEAAGYRLGAANDQDPFAPNRQVLAPGEAIAPGQQKTFSFKLTAPATPGTYHTQWQMLQEGVVRFGAAAAQDVVVTHAPSIDERDLVLQSGRFAIEVSWHDPGSGHAGFGRKVADSDQTGFFWFFDPSNLELMAKALDGRPVNGHFWFFYGALSNVEYWITVTDLHSGAICTYYNPPGEICGGADTSAFPHPPGATCVASGAPAAAATAAFPAAAPSSAAPEPQPAVPGSQPAVPAAPSAAPAAPSAAPAALSAAPAAPSAAPAAAGVQEAAGLPEAPVPLAAPAPPAPSWTAQPFEAGGTPADASGSCVPGPQLLCLLGSRFQVRTRWSLPNASGFGTAVPESDQTGAFWFFDPANLELLVKVLDGRALTGHFWVFYGALSNVEYWVTVTDTATGTLKRYHNPPGNICGVGDTSALD